MPTIGKRYKKTDFGIRFPRTLVSSANVNGEIYFFITIDGRWNDVVTPQGIIHEPRWAREVVKQDTPEPKTKHTFLRLQGEKDFQYLGLLKMIKPYDPKRNLLIVQ